MWRLLLSNEGYQNLLERHPAKSFRKKVHGKDAEAVSCISFSLSHLFDKQ